LDFAVKFWDEFGAYNLPEIYNVDETAVYYDMPPSRIWSEVGAPATVLHQQKHSARLTAVMTVRADGTIYLHFCMYIFANFVNFACSGKKLPILFIVKGVPGGTIETDELPTYPAGHVYAVQENAWMDSRVWNRYTCELLKFEIDSPSVLLLDNFDCHVSEEGVSVIVEETCATVCPLPENSTSVCQLLDVGVMGPLKRKIRSLWLREKVDRTATAKDKRIRSIKRTIRGWQEISADVVRRSFVKAIPKMSSATV